MTLSTSISAKIAATLAGVADHGTPRAELQLDASSTLVTGTGVGAADLIFSDLRTINASSSETLDLNALTDVFGAALNFIKIKAIFIRAAEGNTNDVVVGNAAANPFLGPLGGTTPTITLKPGGVALLTNPAAWAVTNNSNDSLKIANSGAGTSVSYDIMIIGTSA